MSRSRKLNLIKDVSKKTKIYYHKAVRRSNKNRVNQLGLKYSNSIDLHDIDEYVSKYVKRGKEIINDYDYCDWEIHLYVNGEKTISK